jgi:exo-beta-1,3-glucanase (GH17 family)
MKRTAIVKTVLLLLFSLSSCNLWINRPEKTPVFPDLGYINGISYSGFREGQYPGGPEYPSVAEVVEDMSLLSGKFSYIRLYGSDDYTERILKVIAESDLQMKVLLGAWLGNELANDGYKSVNASQVQRTIELENAYPDIVVGLYLANELFYDFNMEGFYNPALEPVFLKYLDQMRELTDKPLSTAEPYTFWESDFGLSLASKLDYIIYHAYPQWGMQSLADSIGFIDEIHSSLKSKYESMPVVLGEIGWSTYSTFHPDIDVEAHETNQSIFLTDLTNWAISNDVTMFIFTAFDELWKGEDGNNFQIEKNWGIYTSQRMPKLWVEDVF